MKRSEFQSRTRLGFVFILTVALLTALAHYGFAQEATAAITGKISDPSGAALAGAAVTAKDADRGTTSQAKTNEDGVYNLVRLPVGRYELRVEAAGFQTAVHAAFALDLNQTAKIDIAMTIGQVSSQIEVSGGAPVLQTQTTEVSTVMDASAISNLPLETRNYQQLGLLVPGAVTISPASFNTGTTTFNAARPQFNGNREQANYYLLDGVENTEFVDNNVAYTPNVDAIQQISVITLNPNAEFGQFMGGVMNVSLKSGANQFHGVAFEYLRNDFFNANEWANNFSGLPTPKQKWNEFGATFGGPIKKNKLFFFTDYQGSHFDLPSSSTPIATLTTQERTGNLSDSPGITLHYPGTTVAMPSNLTQASICGAGQKMGVDPCIAGISPTALKIAGALPQATGAGTIRNANNVESTYTHGNQGDLKLDWAPTDKDRVFARYSQMHIDNPLVNSQPLLYSGNGSNIFPLQAAVLGYTRIVSPSLVNDLRIGMNYYPANAATQALTSTAGANLIPGQPTQYLPGLSFAGSTGLGGQLNGPFAFGTTDGPEIFHQTSIQLSDSVIWTKGAHTVRMGFQGIRYRNNYIPATSSDGAAGQLSFSGTYTGNSEADFFLGLPSYMGYGLGFSGTVGQRNDALGAFVQDDWRVNNHLTVNFGVRWQLFTPIYEVHDRMTNFNEYTGQIELAGQDGNSRALYNQYNGIANFLPRLGLAYSLDEKTVLRAAFSRTSFEEGTGEFNRLATNAPWNVDLVGNWGGVGANGAIPANQVTLDQGFGALGSSSGCTVQNVTSAPAACFAGVRIHATDPNYRPAVSNGWNVTLQRQLTNTLTLQAGYVGQHNDHMAAIYNMGQNVLLPNGTAIPGPYLAGNPTLKNDGLGQQRLNTSTAIENYNALQVVAQERLAKGLTFQVNYTWSKCLTNNQGYYGRYGNSATAQTTADVAFQSYVYNVGLDYGLCDADITNVLTAYANYDLPFGKGRMFLSNASKPVNAILGGWHFDTILTVHGGLPISMLEYGYDATGAYFDTRPDCDSPSIATPFKNFVGGGYVWFDPTTMSIPAQGKLGNCPISSERGPGLRQIDTSIGKAFHISETKYVEFKFDMINAFNTPILAVSGYATDIYPGGGITKSLYGTNTPAGIAYTEGIPTGVVNQSLGARNLQFSVKLHF
jgi:hypothetical protein